MAHVAGNDDGSHRRAAGWCGACAVPATSMNPIIKFTTLFGLLAVELAVSLSASKGPTLGHILAAVFLFAALVFVYRSFYGMRIETKAAV